MTFRMIPNVVFKTFEGLSVDIINILIVSGYMTFVAEILLMM